MSRAPRILLLCPDATTRQALGQEIASGGFQLLPFARPDHALHALARREVEVVLCAQELGEAGSPVDWLISARELDTEAALVLLAGRESAAEVAAEAVNRAGIAKLVLTPWRREDLLDDLGEAAATVRRDTHRSRRFALISARQARIHRDRDRLRGDLERAQRRIATLEDQLDLLERSSIERIVEPDGEAEHIVALLLQVLRGCVPKLVMGCERVAQMALASAQALGWSQAECVDLRHAALLHHIRLPAHPEEDRPRPPGPQATHALEAGELLARLPGMETVADIVARHHDANLDPEDIMRPPRTARLLHVVSAFHCAVRHHERGSGGPPDTTQVLTLATNTLLDAASGLFDPELLTAFLTEHIPTLFGRRERLLALDALEPGMILSRPILSGQLSLLSLGTRLTGPQIDRLGEMAAQHPIHGAWIQATETMDAAGAPPPPPPPKAAGEGPG